MVFAVGGVVGLSQKHGFPIPPMTVGRGMAALWGGPSVHLDG